MSVNSFPSVQAIAVASFRYMASHGSRTHGSQIVGQTGYFFDFTREYILTSFTVVFVFRVPIHRAADSYIAISRPIQTRKFSPTTRILRPRPATSFATDALTGILALQAGRRACNGN